MALRLTLKPHERAILGGAVLTNGKHRAELFVETEVPVLRGSEILSPALVQTPCERIVLAIQLMYVDPQRRAAHEQTYLALVEDVLDASPSTSRLIEPVNALVQGGKYYQALKQAKDLLRYERELLANVH
jgi:flagellar biosynthesis repressor protein FlbT